MFVHHLVAAVARLIAVLVSLALVAWLGLALTTSAAAQAPPPPTSTVPASPTPSPTPRPGATPAPAPGLGLPIPLPSVDPVALIGEGVQRALAEVLATTLRPLRDALRDHLDRQFNILTVTRPEHTVALAQVRQLHDVSRAIANAAVALLVMVGGYNLIFETSQDAVLFAPGATDLTAQVVSAYNSGAGASAAK